MPFLCLFGNLLDRTAAVLQTLMGIKTTFPKGLSRGGPIQYTWIVVELIMSHLDHAQD